MFHYFSEQNQANINGTSATVSMKTWILLYCLSLLSIIPIIGTIAWIVIYLMLAFRADTSISIKNYIKANLIICAVAIVIGIILSIAGIGILGGIVGALS